MSLRDIFLKIEPWLFAAAKPALQSSKARVARSAAAQRYLRGRGAEIGAFVQPIMTPRGCQTAYIDRVPKSYWDGHPEWSRYNIVDVDIIDDGLHLFKVDTHAFDYLIAAHVIEHADDPIQALKNWLRVVKPGGHLLLAVPDKRLYDFDRDRELTTFEHLVHDHEHGPQHSAADHYREWAVHRMGMTDPEKIEAYVLENEPAIHFHTWTLDSFVAFLVRANAYLGDLYEILEVKLNVNEILCVLKVKERKIG